MKSVDYLYGDPTDYDRDTVNEIVHELQARLLAMTETTVIGAGRIKRALNVPPAHARLLASLASGRIMTKDMLAASAVPMRSDELESVHSTGPKVVDVYISNLRKVLRPLGLHIETVFGIGYIAAPETCEFLRAVVACDDEAAAAILSKTKPKAAA